MRALIYLMLIINVSAMTQQEIMIKRIVMEGRQVRSHKELHQKNAEQYKIKAEEYEKKVKVNRTKLDGLYAKHRCNLRDNCQHKRGMKCYKMSRTMKSLLAQIKKDIEVKEKYEKKYLDEDKKAKAKQKREGELRKMYAELKRKKE
jgi:hypothetical protein